MAASVAQKQQDLIHGYIKENLIKESDVYPLELNDIIAQSLGNSIFFVFDIVGDQELIQYIQDKGKCIKGTDMEKRDNFGCSLPLNTDVTVIDIECVEKENGINVIAIVSDIEHCIQSTKPIMTMDGYKYWWLSRMGIFSQFNKKMVKIATECLNHEWQSNDIISIRLDRNEWIITFYLNKEQQCQLPLQKDIDYYLMITTQNSFEYKLLQ